MKRLFLFLFVAYNVLLFTGCKPEPYIIVEQSEFDYPQEGGIGVVSFKCNYTWELQSNDPWITINSSVGVASDNNQIDFVVGQNKSFGQRKGSFTIYSDSKRLRHIITINQMQNDTLLINHDSFTISSDGGTIPISVITNIDFRVSINCDWISQTKALSSKTLYFEIARNPDKYSQREALITIESDQYTKEITIIQTQEDYFSISDHDFDLPNEGGNIDIDVVSNIDYNVSIPLEYSSWIKETSQSTKALDNNHHTFAISENIGDSDRKGCIYFTNATSSFKDSICITQSQTNYLDLGYTYSQLDAKAQSIDVIVNANVPVSSAVIGEAQSWLSVATTKSISASNYIVSTTYFEGSDEDVYRTGQVEFFNRKESISDTLTIVQTADGVYYIKLTTPGTLQNHFDVAEYNSVKKVIISGEVRDNDIYFIRDNLINVELIDFSQISNVAIPYGSFSNDGVGLSMLKRVILPSKLSTINANAFNNCINLVDVVLPETLITIRQYAFAGCQKLTSITLPANLRTIDSYAFYNSGIVSINIPQYVSVIAQATFKGCLSLANVLFEGNLRGISSEAFNGSGLKSISLPSSVTTVGTKAFYDCKSLVSVTIPNGVYSLGSEAFAYCTALTSIQIPSAVTVIENNLVRGCTSLSTFTIPAQITRIDYNALMDCSGMKELICEATTPPQVASDPFTGINKDVCVLKVPTESVEVYKSAKYWQTFVNIEAK